MHGCAPGRAKISAHPTGSLEGKVNSAPDLSRARGVAINQKSLEPAWLIPGIRARRRDIPAAQIRRDIVKDVIPIRPAPRFSPYLDAVGLSIAY